MAAGLGDAAVSGVASKVTESAFDVIGRHISYVFKYQNHMDDLKQQVEQDLKNKRQRVEVDVDNAERQAEEVYDDVKQWLTDVNKFTEEVANLITGEEQKAKKHLCKGLCPNYIKRYKLSKKAVKAAKDAARLLGKGNFSKVSFRRALQRTTSMYVGGYEGFDSRDLNLEDIMEALKDADSKIIGVWGMGGVGKTTLVKKAAAQVVEEKLFDTVVMAEVTQTINYKQIQDKIAYDLDLEFGLESQFERAGRIRDRLRREKRVLIILDNLWGKVDLEAVGIFLRDFEKETAYQKQEREGNDDNQRRYKILLTSREENVLVKDMNTEKIIFISPLSTKETLNWFWKIAGASGENSDFHSIAVQIVEKCAGLPLAVTTIATALKDKNLEQWKDALKQLKMCNMGNPSDPQSMHSITKYSYDLLKEDGAKLLSELYGLFNTGSGTHIDDLLYYGTGLEWFKNYTLEEGRDRLSTLIGDLRASCLLLGGSYEWFKMHDIIHAVAVRTASTKGMVNLQNVSLLKEELQENIPEDSTAVSMPYTDIDELPEKFKRKNLKLFLLFAKDPSLKIPEAFFEGTKELKVLDLSFIHLPSLPSSLCDLTSLRTLCLDGCQLGDVRNLGKLRKLEILTFRNSDIKLLPAEIGQLTRLRVLNLSRCSKLKIITPNVISNLSRLEELYMDDGFVDWEVEGLNNQLERCNASLCELKNLSRMTTLTIHIKHGQHMPQDLFSQQQLKRFRIFIGGGWIWSRKYESCRMLKLNLNKGIHLRHGIRMLLKKAEDLSLDELSGVGDDVYEVDGEGFPNLKYLHVQNGPELLYVVNSRGKVIPYNAFPVLESLFLHNLIKLEKICQGQLSKGSFSKLKLLEVCKCGSLRYIFTPPVVMGLEQLQKMTIKECAMLEEIITKEGEKDSVVVGKIIFPLLDAIILDNLSNLKVFYSGSNILEFPSLKSITIRRCPKMETFVYNDMKELHLHRASLFSHKVRLTNLEKLEISRMYELRKLWPNKLSLESFDKLKELRLHECSSLEEIVSYMEEETVAKEEVAEAGPTFVFPHLILMKLVWLPNLTNFYPRKHISKWPKLEHLTVRGCDKVQILIGIQDICRESRNATIPIQQPLFSVDKVGLSSLEKLKIKWMDNLQKIWQSELSMEISFGKLKELEVERCNKLVNIFSYDMIGGLQRLNVLTVSVCGSLKEIVSCMEEETIVKGKVGEVVPTFVFPQLNSLTLDSLPNVTNFYPKKHISKWPMLERLRVERCDKVEIFASQFLILQDIHGESQREILMQQPLFFVDTEHSQPIEVFKNLGTVRVSHSYNLEMIKEITTESEVEEIGRLANVALKLFRDLIIFLVLQVRPGKSLC